MSHSNGAGDSKLLVLTDDQSFGAAIVDTIADLNIAASAERVEPPADGLTTTAADTVAGAIVDTELSDPVGVIKRLTATVQLPVVAVTTETRSEVVDSIIQAGATDIFPRTTANSQYELVAEQLLNESTYDLFDIVQDAITVHDAETGEIVDVNDAYCELVGGERAEVLATDPMELSVPAEGYTEEYAEEIFEEVLETGQKSYEWMIQTKSGEYRIADVVASRAEIDGEKRVISISRDITERKRRKQEFEEIFNAVQDAITVHDVETGEIVDANDAYCELVGYDRERLLEMDGIELSVPAEGYTEAYAEEIFAEVMDRGQKSYTWKIQTKDGERRMTEVAATRAKIDGEKRLINVSRDITERERREQRLEVFNRILRHNLRNRLDVIRSHAEELADSTEATNASQILTEVSELASLGGQARKIDHLMSRDEILAATDVIEMLHDAIDMADPTANNVEIQTDLPETHDLWTDKEVLSLALTSALENAIEHASSLVEITAEATQRECVITIADDGSGIEADSLAPIEAGTETMLQHGTGLRLWQLRWSVNKLNGELSFRVNNGTTVEITLPNRHRTAHNHTG